LKAAGKVIGPYSLVNAATALHFDHSVARLDMAEFRQVPGLRLIDAARYTVRTPAPQGGGAHGLRIPSGMLNPIMVS
jgi:hypothetical protein